jgi:hypothetical protein
MTLSPLTTEVTKYFSLVNIILIVSALAISVTTMVLHFNDAEKEQFSFNNSRYTLKKGDSVGIVDGDSSISTTSHVDRPKITQGKHAYGFGISNTSDHIYTYEQNVSSAHSSKLTVYSYDELKKLTQVSYLMNVSGDYSGMFFETKYDLIMRFRLNQGTFNSINMYEITPITVIDGILKQKTTVFDDLVATHGATALNFNYINLYSSSHLEPNVYKRASAHIFKNQNYGFYIVRISNTEGIFKPFTFDSDGNITMGTSNSLTAVSISPISLNEIDDTRCVLTIANELLVITTTGSDIQFGSIQTVDFSAYSTFSIYNASESAICFVEGTKGIYYNYTLRNSILTFTSKQYISNVPFETIGLVEPIDTAYGIASLRFNYTHKNIIAIAFYENEKITFSYTPYINMKQLRVPKTFFVSSDEHETIATTTDYKQFTEDRAMFGVGNIKSVSPNIKVELYGTKKTFAKQTFTPGRMYFYTADGFTDYVNPMLQFAGIALDANTILQTQLPSMFEIH